jgi:hypothetical protein
VRQEILQALYDRVILGLPLLGTPQRLASRLLEETGTPAAAADAALSLATVLGGGTGFVFGLPGFALAPVTLPANLVGAAGIQLHLAATIATLAGREPGDPRTRDECIACLEKKIGRPGHNPPDRAVAVRTGAKALERLLRYAGESAARGSGWAGRGVLLRQVGRRIPGVGGLIGAGADGFMTLHVGRCAQARFLGIRRLAPVGAA